MVLCKENINIYIYVYKSNCLEGLSLVLFIGIRQLHYHVSGGPHLMLSKRWQKILKERPFFASVLHEVLLNYFISQKAETSLSITWYSYAEKQK